MKSILVIIGGSGTGKTTVAEGLQKRGYQRLVTTTTRSMRDGEVNHESYHFVTRDEFFQLDRLEENEYAGYMYGLTKNEINNKLDQYDKLIVVMDVNGAISMKKHYNDIVRVVFLTIPPKVMQERLRNRGDSEKNVQSRMDQARKFKEFDKPAIADLSIENIDLEGTLNQIETLKKEAS